MAFVFIGNGRVSKHRTFADTKPSFSCAVLTDGHISVYNIENERIKQSNSDYLQLFTNLIFIFEVT